MYAISIFHISNSNEIYKFSERYEHLHQSGNATTYTAVQDSDSNMSDDDLDDTNATKPWLSEFHRYLNTHDVIPENMTIVKWWGVHTTVPIIS